MSDGKKYPLRILQIGMSTNYGGTEAFLMNLYRNIDRAKYQFDFLNVYDEPLACQDEIISLGGNIYNLHLRRRQDGLKKYKEGIKKFYREHHFDIVSQNVQDLINIDMIKYAKKNGIKTIIHAHNSGNGMRQRFLTKISLFRNKITYGKYADICLACSKAASAFVFGNENKGEFVMNGIDVNKFKYSLNNRDDYRKKNAIDQSVTIYSHVARVDYQKNQFFLLDVFKEICSINSNSLLLVCGGGAGLDELIHYARKLGIDSKVKFLGKVVDTDTIYSASDYFLLPSRFEGFSVTLVEAQTSGLKCIISNKVPTDEKIDELITSISLREDASTWAKIIVGISKNEKRLDYVKKAEELFSVRNTVNKMEEIYGR